MADTHRKLGDDAWVEFRDSGYPFILRKQLKDAVDDEALVAVIHPYILRCNIPVINEDPVASGPGIAARLNFIDEKYTTRLIMEFYDFRAERVREPISKNS